MVVKIPILKVENVLVASIQTSLDDLLIVHFQNSLLEMVSTTGASGVLVDITAVDVVDSFLARSLNDIAIAVHLLGTTMAVVGMQPSVAITLVEMGLTIPNAITALNLDKGLKLLKSEIWSDNSGDSKNTGRNDVEKRNDRDQD